MHYFVSETASDGSVYSCDKICITGKLLYHSIDSFTSSLNMFFITNTIEQVCESKSLPFGYKGMKQYIFYEKFGISHFRNNFNIILSDDTSFYFGYKHNTQIGSESNCSWKIELNPNKCLPCDFTSKFIRYVISYSQPRSLNITQMDIAIDLKVDRFNVYLEKDIRKYTRIDSGSDNITEYLSKHNENGFVKLYNKTAESKLDYTLTRLEITVRDLSFKNFKDVFPKVYVHFQKQMTFDDADFNVLSQNDQIFVTLLKLHPDYFKKLTFRKQQKFKVFFTDDSTLLEPDLVAYLNLIKRIGDEIGVSE